VKKLLLTLLFLPTLALAQPAKVDVVWNLANTITAMVVGLPVWVAAVATGQEPELCGVLQGTYDPTATDHCVGGDWVRILPYLKEASPSHL
jgi:hypothetical protein